MLKRIRTIILGLVAVTAVVALSACTPPEEDGKTHAEKVVAKQDQQQAAAKAPEKEEAPEPKYTTAQENAIASATDYLSFAAFSRSSLIEQLEFEDYSTADATFAVNHITVDYNQQAAASAKDYLDFSSFSRQGLIDQLTFEGFTQAQATYGVNQTGL